MSCLFKISARRDQGGSECIHHPKTAIYSPLVYPHFVHQPLDAGHRLPSVPRLSGGGSGQAQSRPVQRRA